eukprot:7435014-Karenia_brevis.AAC.1
MQTAKGRRERVAGRAWGQRERVRDRGEQTRDTEMGRVRGVKVGEDREGREVQLGTRGGRVLRR